MLMADATATGAVQDYCWLVIFLFYYLVCYTGCQGGLHDTVYLYFLSFC